MRTIALALSAASLALPATMMLPSASAQAKTYHRGHYYHHRKVCRRSKGTTGLVAGGVGGALVGNSILGHGVLGTVAGGVGGAFAGRAIDRTITARKRCYYR